MLLSTHGIIAQSASSTPAFQDITSFSFDGVDDFMETNANYTMLDNSQFFSISLWVNLPSLSTAQRLIYLVGTRRIFMYVRTTGVVDCSMSSSSYFIRSNTNAITANNWAHIVWTYDGTQSRYNRYNLYVNGVLNVASDNGTIYNSLQTFTQPLNIGKVSSSYLNGKVNEPAFWNTVLTASEVLEIYNSGTANDLNNLPSGTANPQNWWRSENATFDGTNWSVPDTNGSFPITTSNMGVNSIVNDVP